MAKDKTLLILAGGMGSRFGGLKQIQPVDKDNNFLIDYSIYDAKKAGFNKVVFVIKEENQKVFSETVGDRIAGEIDVDYAYQSLDKFVPEVPEGRVKPWGTGHAVLCAKDKVQGDFAIINADDFYGRDAFMTASRFMDEHPNPNEYGLIAYKVGNTLTENGAVKRGVCDVTNGVLTGMTESSVEVVNGQVVATALSNGETRVLNEDDPVSMNLICFNSKFFDYLEKDFSRFYKENKDNLTAEHLIQNAMMNQSKGAAEKAEAGETIDEIMSDVETADTEESAVTVVYETNSQWQGVTYREDLQAVVDGIQSLIDGGDYPEHLWASQKESSIQRIVNGKDENVAPRQEELENTNLDELGSEQ